MPLLRDALILPLIAKADSPILEISMVLVAAWLARYGGAEQETAVAEASRLGPSLDGPALEQIRLSLSAYDLAGLQLACEVLFAVADVPLRKRLLRTFVEQAVCDGYLTLAQQEFLLFLADVFAVSPEEFEAVYMACTGTPLPPLPDPGSAAWWEQRHKAADTQGREMAEGIRDYPGKMRDMGLLGLKASAGREDVRRAFLRLAQIHHPDKFHRLGKEAEEEARCSFSLIKEAYERLIRHA